MLKNVSTIIVETFSTIVELETFSTIVEKVSTIVEKFSTIVETFSTIVETIQQRQFLRNGTQLRGRAHLKNSAWLGFPHVPEQ